MMNREKLEDSLNELVREIGGGGNPKSKKLVRLAKEAQQNHQRLAESVNRLQESLDYLRVCIKYQLFDLEATRRENEYLRKLLEKEDS